MFDDDLHALILFTSDGSPCRMPSLQGNDANPYSNETLFCPLRA